MRDPMEKTKSLSNRTRRKKRNPGQRHRKRFQQNHRRKCLQPEEGQQIPKQIASEMAVPMIHSNQNAKHIEQRKTIKSYKEERLSNI